MKKITGITLIIALFVTILLTSKITFEAIYYSDMPMWIKYFLLR